MRIRHDQQRVTVGRCFGDRVGTDDRTGARAILDQKGLFGFFGKMLCEHPRVAKCIVLPVQLSETVARLKAVIIPADPAHPPAGEELRHFARGRLTPHKVPRIFEIRESLPSSPTGKILRHLVEA